MNYSFLPKKRTTSYTIFDRTCIYCHTENCSPSINYISCNSFHCPKCSKQFVSTKIVKKIVSESKNEN